MTEDFYRQIDEAEAEMRRGTEKLDRLREFNAVLANLVGRAESEDGHVRVEYTTSGLHELIIEPRAMRMMSEDLAATIKKTQAEAIADFRAQSAQALRDADLVADPQTREETIAAAQQRLAGASEKYATSMRTAMQRIDQATRAVRRTS